MYRLQWSYTSMFERLEMMYNVERQKLASPHQYRQYILSKELCLHLLSFNISVRDTTEPLV